jgi:uncharacterized glyoxalase superfamily protein PhnB
MTDPLDALRTRISPVQPDPAFTAELRARLQRALLLPDSGEQMTTQTATTTVSPQTLTPYLAVDDARRAVDWYATTFGGVPGEPIVMPDGRIGHAEVRIGAATLALADEHPELGLLGPNARGGVSQSIVIDVSDVDTVIDRAVAGGARLERPARDEPYGRMGVVIDPFGHRWMVNTPPPAETTAAEPAAEPAGEPTASGGPAHGDVAYLTYAVADDDRAREFYGAVLGWRFRPGSVDRGWQIEGTAPMGGLHGGQPTHAVTAMFFVDDIDAAVRAVRQRGGQAAEPQQQPYGRSAECVDDQGAEFQLLQR